jgi:Xaa-Pro aminopeptidase
MNKQIKKLIQLLKERKLDSYLIPSNDEFNKKYNNKSRLKYMTSFSGSYGVALVTYSKCYFFTDGRYTKQASEELDKDFQIINIRETPLETWLLAFISKGNKLGFDPKLHSIKQIQILEKNIQNKRLLIPIEENLVDLVESFL